MSLAALAAANAAAAAAAAGKKAAQVQLQAELNNDDEWNKFLQREGLLVIDVYSEWCGPCIGMVGNLKKIKVEIGGDNLHLAIARADTIECLKRFRNRSEPTWMFIAAGQLVNVVFGADAPRLARTIEAELKSEEEARGGLRQRPQRAPHELTPQEQELVVAAERAAEQRRERERAAARAAREARREVRASRLDAHFSDLCPALLLPHAHKHLRKVADALEPHGVVVADKCPLVVGRESARWLAVEEPELGAPAALAALAERPSLALLLKKLPEKEGDVIALARRALFGDDEEDAGKGSSVAEEVRADDVPGLMVPADRHQRAAVLDVLFPKMVCAVVEPPSVAEPPHMALMFGAWQRRAVMAAAAQPHLAPRVLRYGFFAGIDVERPQLLAKTLDDYELRPDKDYAETIVLMVAVGAAEPALAEPDQVDGAPPELLELGPIHVSEDAVVGAVECERFFPVGYDAPKPTPKPKEKKKKKKRHENKEESSETSVEARGGEGEGADADAAADGEPEPEDAEGAEAAEGATAGDEAQADKATSPPPQTPH